MKYSKKKKKGRSIHTIRCPYCRKPARLISAEGILPPFSKITHLYACSDFPKCDTYVCVHAGTDKPMGTLADAKLRTLRQTAHRSFDQIHTSGLMSKTDAYAWLADRVSMPRRDAHIGHFSEYHCQLVIDESRRLLADYRRRMCSEPYGHLLREA